LNVLAQCVSVLEVPYPKHDSERAVKSAPNKEQFKERVRVVLDGITDKLKKNLGGQTYTSAIQQAKGRTYSMAVPMPEVVDPNGSQVYGFEPPGSPQSTPYGFNNNNNTYNPQQQNNQNNYYQQQQSPPQNYYTNAPPPPPLPNSNSGMDIYNAPPPTPERDPPYGTVKGPPMSSGSPPPTPPPPPPLSRKPTAKFSKTQEEEAFDSFDHNETAAVSDNINIEYDDSNYESNVSPPPPPPPPV